MLIVGGYIIAGEEKCTDFLKFNFLWKNNYE